MGKSPAKWIKTVLFGKKSSRSSFSKGTTIQEKASLTAKSQTGDLALNPPVLTDQTRQITGIRGENIELERGTSMNSRCETDEVLSVTANENISVGLIPSDEHELAKLEETATKVQAAFRGYLARRAFRALKGIIRLQALVRGHLVRRQAVATLRCMRSIVKLQSRVRGRKVRVSDIGLQVLRKDSLVDFVGVAKFVRSEKLSRNVFATKLVASLPNAMPLSLQYDVIEPNSADTWLERWSISHFWEPLPRQKKILDPKPKRKQPSNIHTEDSEKPKRGIWKVSSKVNDTNSESEKPKRIPRKVQAPPTEPDPPQIELEKVKRNLRKVSVSAAASSEKTEPAVPEKPLVSLKKVSSTSPIHDVTEKSKSTESKPTNQTVIETAPEEKLLEDVKVSNENLTDPTVEVPSQEVNGKVNNGAVESEPVAAKEEQGSSGKENLKTRRRRSLPVKAELTESVPQNSPTVPSYMAATESAKAKLRAQESLRLAEEGIENGSVRRYSLPTSGNGKMNTPSPRMQKPLVNGKSGGNKSGRLVVSAAKDGWKR